MNTAVLRGREHAILGGIAAVAEARAAIALSRGGAPKRYAHADPNEDAAAFAEGPGGLLLAVADAHGGHEASEIAVERLVAGWAEPWTGGAAAGLGERWSEVSRAALFDACETIHRRAAQGGRDTSRTTLSLALVRPDQDWLGWIAIGDSHLFLVDDARAVELAVAPRSETWFLGHPAETRESLGDKVRSGTRSLAGARALALVTDGLSERGIGVDAPAETVAAAVRCAYAEARADHERVPLETARGIVAAALDAHRRHASGDNVAAAVACVESSGRS